MDEKRNKRKVLSELRGNSPSSNIFNQLEAEITICCTEDLEEVLEKLKEQMKINADSSDKLAKRVFWLNLVLTIATFIGAIATLKTAFPNVF